MKFLNSKIKNFSITRLCNILDIRDDNIVASAMANLEAQGDVILSGFRKIYCEDGGEIHLSLYSIV
ncbi:MAG: hypothetical protein P1P85_05110 [Patescibacteria group bacterium]|nr:hypothetical protein [Patescibacteria group bacterium]